MVKRGRLNFFNADSLPHNILNFFNADSSPRSRACSHHNRFVYITVRGPNCFSECRSTVYILLVQYTAFCQNPAEKLNIGIGHTLPLSGSSSFAQLAALVWRFVTGQKFLAGKRDVARWMLGTHLCPEQWRLLRNRRARSAVRKSSHLPTWNQLGLTRVHPCRSLLSDVPMR